MRHSFCRFEQGGRDAYDGAYRVHGIGDRVSGLFRWSEKVSDSFELKYEVTKDEQVGHVHVFVDNEYQRGFHGMFKGLSRGEHQITVKTTSKDHSTVTASHTIMVDVQ